MNRFKLYHIFLLLLFLVTPFVDVLSGYLILSGKLAEGGAGSPSQIFRFLLLTIALVIASENKLYFIILFFLTSYVIFLEGIFSSFHQSFYGYAIGLIYASKLIYLIAVFFAIKQIFYHNQLNPTSLLKLIANNILISSILLILPFCLGIGYSTYALENGFGFKGFFASNNGLGLYLGTGLMLIIYYWHKSKTISTFISILIVLFSTIIIGSKTTLLFSTLGVVSLILLLEHKVISIILALILTVSSILFFDYLISFLETIFDVVMSRYYNNPSFFSFIFSSRDVFLLDAWDSINLEGLYIFRIILGFGPYISFRDPLVPYDSIDILESDFSDLLFMYGLLFISTYLIILILLLKKSLQQRNFFIFLVLLLWSGHSLLAGHALLNGMSGTLLPLIAILVLYDDKQIKNQS